MRNKLCPGLVAAASAAFLLRRQGKRWGATGDEMYRSLAGDDLVPQPTRWWKRRIPSLFTLLWSGMG
jgi:hypothetical protein